MGLGGKPTGVGRLDGDRPTGTEIATSNPVSDGISPRNESCHPSTTLRMTVVANKGLRHREKSQRNARGTTKQSVYTYSTLPSYIVIRVNSACVEA